MLDTGRSWTPLPTDVQDRSRKVELATGAEHCGVQEFKTAKFNTGMPPRCLRPVLKTGSTPRCSTAEFKTGSPPRCSTPAPFQGLPVVTTAVSAVSGAESAVG